MTNDREALAAGERAIEIFRDAHEGPCENGGFDHQAVRRLQRRAFECGAEWQRSRSVSELAPSSDEDARIKQIRAAIENSGVGPDCFPTPVESTEVLWLCDQNEKLAAALAKVSQDWANEMQARVSPPVSATAADMQELRDFRAGQTHSPSSDEDAAVEKVVGPWCDCRTDGYCLNRVRSTGNLWCYTCGAKVYSAADPRFTEQMQAAKSEHESLKAWLATHHSSPESETFAASAHRAGFRAGQARQRPEVTRAMLNAGWRAWMDSDCCDEACCQPNDGDLATTKRIINAALDVLFGERNAAAKGGE